MRGVWVLCVLLCLAAGGDAALSTEQQQALLDKHNTLRSAEGASNMRYMSWSSTLAEKAQSWADGCRFTHDTTDYGENLFAHSSKSISDVTVAVQDWFDEKTGYDYDTLSCSSPPCGHYTQVVWATTYEVGCGMAVCDPLDDVHFGSGTYIVCNYNPPGNYQGVKPFKTGNACTACDNGIYNCYQDMCMTDCTGLDCDCKACDVCQNCASITSDCSCQCAKGWKGKTCTGTCEQTVNCNYGENACVDDAEWMSQNCPIYCKLCEPSDGSSDCTVTGEEFCGIQTTSTTSTADTQTVGGISPIGVNQNSTDSQFTDETEAQRSGSSSVHTVLLLAAIEVLPLVGIIIPYAFQ